MDLNDDFSLFRDSLNKVIQVDTGGLVKIVAGYRHMYDRCVARGIFWPSVVKAISYVMKYKLCYLIYELNLSRPTSIFIRTDDFMVYVGLYDDTIIFRTVLTTDMNFTESRTDKYINLMKKEIS